MPPLSGYSAALPTDVHLDSAVLFLNASTPYGVSKGEIAIEMAQKFGNVEFDGKYYDIEGLDRPMGGTLKITGTFIESNATKILDWVPGGVATTVAGPPSVTTVVPPDAGVLFANGSPTYKTNVVVALRRGGGRFTCIVIPVALMWTESATGKNKAEGEIKVTIEARQAHAAADTGVAPWSIQDVSVIPA